MLASMGQYGTYLYITDELRREAAVDLDHMLGDECRRKAEDDGYQPVGEASVRWYQLTEFDVELRKDLDVTGIPYRAGDWDARVVVDVKP